MEHHDHPEPELMIKEYMKVFIALFILTAFTILFAYNWWVPESLDGSASMLHISMGLFIALIKAAMVIYIFMHIKFDNKFLRAFIFVPLFLLAVLSFALNVLGP
jgi:caa(3)-type oxidase subunit IV